MTQKGNLVRQVKGVARIGRSGIKIHPVLINQYDTGFTEVAWFLCQCTGTRSGEKTLRAIHTVSVLCLVPSHEK